MHTWLCSHPFPGEEESTLGRRCGSVAQQRAPLWWTIILLLQMWMWDPVELLPVGFLRVKLIWAVRGATGITKAPRKSLPSLGALRSPIEETPGKSGVNEVLVAIKKLFYFLLQGMLPVLPVLSQLSRILSSNEWPVCPCEHGQLSVGLCSITGINSYYQGCSLWQKGCGDPLGVLSPSPPLKAAVPLTGCGTKWGHGLSVKTGTQGQRRLAWLA